MILNEIFGSNARIKILEELLSNWDSYLTADEISRMSDVSLKSVYNHMEQLDEIGILKTKKNGSMMFKLNPDDKRAIFLSLIESDEIFRQNNFETWDINEIQILNKDKSEPGEKETIELHTL